MTYFIPGEIRHQEKSSMTGNYLMPMEETLWSNFVFPKRQEIKVNLCYRLVFENVVSCILVGSARLLSYCESGHIYYDLLITVHDLIKIKLLKQHNALMSVLNSR